MFHVLELLDAFEACYKRIYGQLYFKPFSCAYEPFQKHLMTPNMENKCVDLEMEIKICSNYSNQIMVQKLS